MKYVSINDVVKHQNSPTCQVLEYPMEDTDINGAVGIVNGRYPEQGFIVNEKCKELAYIVSGSGALTTETDSIKLSPGDTALIPAGEPYFFEGKKLTIFMPCTPAWYSEQHKEVK